MALKFIQDLIVNRLRLHLYCWKQAISQMITVGFDGSNLFNGQNISIVK